MKRMISHIVAVSENNVIGVNNDLPWDIPEDMQFFKDTTKDHAIIMGRKTFDSLGKGLPKRLNIVVTRQSGFQAPGAIVVPDLKAALEYSHAHPDGLKDEIFIIGGGEIYKQSLPIVDRIYLTRIHQSFNGDVKYPELDPSQFREVDRRARPGNPPYTFFIYERVSKGDLK